MVWRTRHNHELAVAKIESEVAFFGPCERWPTLSGVSLEVVKVLRRQPPPSRMTPVKNHPVPSETGSHPNTIIQTLQTMLELQIHRLPQSPPYQAPLQLELPLYLHPLRTSSTQDGTGYGKGPVLAISTRKPSSSHSSSSFAPSTFGADVQTGPRRDDG